MSVYPQPNDFLPIYNPSEYSFDTTGLTIAEGDARYLRLTGGIVSGLTTFNAGVQTASLFSSGNTFTMPSASGQLALTSDIPGPGTPLTLNLTTNNDTSGSINYISHTSSQTQNEATSINVFSISEELDSSYDLSNLTLMQTYIDGKTAKTYDNLQIWNSNAEFGDGIGGHSDNISNISCNNTVYSNFSVDNYTNIRSSSDIRGTITNVDNLNIYLGTTGSITNYTGINSTLVNSGTITNPTLINCGIQTNSGTIGSLISLNIASASGGTISGNATGINIYDVLSCDNYTGLSIDVSGVTASSGKIGIQCNGKLNFNVSQDAVSSLITPDSINLFQPTLNINASITSSDYVCNNLAAIISASDDYDHTGTAFDLGILGCGFVGQFSVASGKTVSKYSWCGTGGAVAAGSAGTIDEMNFFLSKGLFQAGGNITINNLYAFKVDTTFNLDNDPFGIGNPSTFVNVWGFYNSSTTNNYFKKNLVIGDTNTPTSDDVALEINSKKAILLPQLTTAEKNALTAVAGMFVYDTTLNQMSYYNGSVWVDV